MNVVTILTGIMLYRNALNRKSEHVSERVISERIVSEYFLSELELQDD